MCKLLIGLQLNESKEFNEIITHEAIEMSTMPDGMGGIVVGQDDKTVIVRHLKDYSTVLKKLFARIPTAKLFGLHTRVATTGAISMENIHFFRVGDYIMAHNGYVTDYSAFSSHYTPTNPEWFSQENCNDGYNYGNIGKKKYKKFKKKTIDIGDWGEMESEITKLHDIYIACQDCRGEDDYCKKHTSNLVKKKSLESKVQKIEKIWEELEEKYSKKESRCDSLQFLQSLPQEDLTAEIIKKHMEDKSFSGVGVILNLVTKEVFLFSTRDIKVQTDFKDYILFYSYDPDETIKEYKSFLGISFTTEGKKIHTFDLEEGVYKFYYTENNPEILSPLSKETSLVVA